MDKTKNQKVDRLSQPPGSSPQISVAERLAEELNYQFGNKKEERVQYRCSIEKNSALIFTMSSLRNATAMDRGSTIVPSQKDSLNKKQC